MASVRLSRYRVEERQLPFVCMKCGEEATAERRKRFSWFPPWIVVIMIFALLPGAIVAMILTKYMTVYAPMCDRHQNHWSWRTWFTWLTLLGILVFGLLGVVAGVALNDNRRGAGEAMFGVACVGMAVLGLAWLIAVVLIQNASIRPTEITDRGITLKNVSPYFRDALHEERRQREYEDHYRRPSRRAWENEDDDEAFFDRDRG